MAEIKWNDHLEEDIKALLKAKMHEGAQIVLESPRRKPGKVWHDEGNGPDRG